MNNTYFKINVYLPNKICSCNFDNGLRKFLNLLTILIILTRTYLKQIKYCNTLVVYKVKTKLINTNNSRQQIILR